MRMLNFYLEIALGCIIPNEESLFCFAKIMDYISLFAHARSQNKEMTSGRTTKLRLSIFLYQVIVQAAHLTSMDAD